MSIWKRLFGGGSKAPPPQNQGSVVLTGDDEVFERYNGGSIEGFYKRMSRDLIAKHGPLVSVDFGSAFPQYEIWFCYKDGCRIYSGGRTNEYNIHYLAFGTRCRDVFGKVTQFGEGTRFARHFLAAAGFDLTSEQVESIK